MDIWKVGPVRESCTRKCFPSARSVLQVFFYHHKKLKKTVRASSYAVAAEVKEVWANLDAPTRKQCHVAAKIEKMFSTWRVLMANRKKTQNCYVIRRQHWQTQLDQIFDVAKHLNQNKASNPPSVKRGNYFKN